MDVDFNARTILPRVNCVLPLKLKRKAVGCFHVNIMHIVDINALVTCNNYLSVLIHYVNGNVLIGYRFSRVEYIQGRVEC